jgi:small subunit ribosomal protein S6
MRRYESVVIIGSEMTDDDIRSFAERYSEIINNGNGEVIKLDDWGVKRLAYLVKKQEKGRYVLFDYLGDAALVSELERRFRISEEVMKFITVKIDDNVDPEALKAKMKEEREAQEAARAKRSEEAAPKAETEQAVAAEPEAEEQTPAEQPQQPTAEEPAKEPEAAEPAPEPETATTTDAGKEETSDQTTEEASSENPEEKKEGGE